MQRAAEVRGVGFQSIRTRGESAIPSTLQAVLSLSPRNACLVAPEGTKKYQWADLPTDFPQTPWALFLTDRSQRFHLLGIDLDDKEEVAASDVANDLALVRAVCDKLELPYLICASGGGAGRHVWLHCEPTSAAIVARINAALKTLCSTFDNHPLSNASTGCLRAPGSPHRNGGASRILPHGDHLTGMHALRHLKANPCPTSRIEALADTLAALAQPILDAQQHQQVEASTAASKDSGANIFPAAQAHAAPAVAGLHSRRELQPFAQAMLDQRPGPDASRTSHTIARSFVYAGFGVDDFIRAALHDQAPGLEHIRTERVEKTSRRTPRIDPETYARHQFLRAIASVPAHHLQDRTEGFPDDTERRHEIEQIALTAVETALRGAMWTGATGSVLHRTLAALASVSISRGRRTVTLSARSWAKQAGLTAPQISQAARTLEDGGWIECVSPAAGPLAAQWRVIDKRDRVQWVTHFSNTGGAQGGSRDSREELRASQTMVDLAPESGRHNCWSLPNVGTTGHALWLALQVHGSLSEAGLAGRLGLDIRTVRKTLQAMALFDLVRGCGGGLFRALPLDRADSHCSLLGLEGVQERRWRRYAVESALWAVRCAERVWRTSLDKRTMPAEVARLRENVCVDGPVFRCESSFPRMLPTSTEKLIEFAQAWRRRLVDGAELTFAEHALIGSVSVAPSLPTPPTPDRSGADVLVAA
ncbi:MAG: hypothetical protein DI630_12655 [Gordonia sp. (in: high G+C Gram-positive bacteria)]|nr:MAG: hypothetical protein DI630_12655 [Gordonia sp. (in: high G+C Gram-positive bacteria)]